MILLRSALEEPAGTDPEPVAPAGNPRRVDRAMVAFLLLGAIFGSVFALVTPPFWGPDESAHYLRAYALSEGQIAPREIPDLRGPNFGGVVPSSVRELADFASRQLARQPDAPAPRVTDDDQAEALAARPIAGPTEVTGFPSSSTYSPVPYLASVPALAVARAAGTSVGASITLMRFANLALYLALGAAALGALRRFRVKWLLFVVATLPMALFQGAMISTDPLTTGLVFVSTALVAKSVFLRVPLRRREVAVLAATAVLIPLAKNAYLIFLLAPALVAFGGARRVPRDRVAPFAAGATLLLGMGAFVWWAVTALPTGVAQGLLRSSGGPVDPARQVGFVLADPGEFVQVLGRTFVIKGNMYFSQFLGDLGWAFVPIPSSAWVAIVAAAVLAAGTSERLRAGRPATAAVGAAVALGVAAVFGALYLGFSPVGYYIIDGVQGRYFIPYALLAAMVVLQVVPLRLDTSVLASPRRVPAAIIVLTALALTLGAAKYSYVLWH